LKQIAYYWKGQVGIRAGKNLKPYQGLKRDLDLGATGLF